MYTKQQAVQNRKEMAKGFVRLSAFLFFSSLNTLCDLSLEKLQGHIRTARNSSPVCAKLKERDKILKIKTKLQARITLLTSKIILTRGLLMLPLTQTWHGSGICSVRSLSPEIGKRCFKSLYINSALNVLGIYFQAMLQTPGVHAMILSQLQEISDSWAPPKGCTFFMTLESQQASSSEWDTLVKMTQDQLLCP